MPKITEAEYRMVTSQRKKVASYGWHGSPRYGLDYYNPDFGDKYSQPHGFAIKDEADGTWYGYVELGDGSGGLDQTFSDEDSCLDWVESQVADMMWTRG